SYENTYVYTKQMFPTFLIFPTAILNANVLIAMKLEKLDMWTNIMSLTLYLAVCFTGLYYIKSLTVINVSIFGSWIAFHLMQCYYLKLKSILNIKQIASVYLYSTTIVLAYLCLEYLFQSQILFVVFWGTLAILSSIKYVFSQ